MRARPSGCSSLAPEVTSNAPVSTGGGGTNGRQGRYRTLPVEEGSCPRPRDQDRARSEGGAAAPASLDGQRLSGARESCNLSTFLRSLGIYRVLPPLGDRRRQARAGENIVALRRPHSEGRVVGRQGHVYSESRRMVRRQSQARAEAAFDAG